MVVAAPRLDCSSAWFFMFGCGSTSQPERPIQVVARQESLPEAKAQS